MPLWGWGILRGSVGTVGKEEEHPAPVHAKVNSASTHDMMVWTSKQPGWLALSVTTLQLPTLKNHLLFLIY